MRPTKPTKGRNPALPPPIDLDRGPMAKVSDAKLAEWKQQAREFQRDPKSKTKFAVEFADLVLIRLDDILRTATSPKTILDVAAKGEKYVAFAFKETKE